MKEKLFEILHNRKRMPGERFSDIEGKIEHLVNQEVERRIAARLDGFDIVYDFGEAFKHQHLKTQQTKWQGVLWMLDWYRSRLTPQVTPQDTHQVQKEGGIK